MFQVWGFFKHKVTCFKNKDITLWESDCFSVSGLYYFSLTFRSAKELWNTPVPVSKQTQLEDAHGRFLLLLSCMEGK